MSTYTQLYYHIVFSTKHRERAFPSSTRDHLFRYMARFVQNHNGHVYRINGIDDHVHLLIRDHPKIAIAAFIRELKTATALWIKQTNLFPRFRQWQEGYGAFTVAHHDRNAVIQYIKNQEEHHRRESPMAELRRLLDEAGIEYQEQYLA